MALKKKRTPAKRTHPVIIFAAGLFFPICMALGWHAAYGQQDAPASPGAVSPLSPTSVHKAAEQELAELDPVFADMVRKPTIERLNRTIKMWEKSPKVVRVLEERRRRLTELPPAYFEFIRSEVTAVMAKAGKSFDTSQFFVFADRNPAAQFVTIGLYDNKTGRMSFLGADLISSGNITKGGDYFETPVGVFENVVDNFSYRALGTPNQDGWRGLGVKGSRVWDFGDQPGLKKYKDGTTISQMRLLMHSTDPDKGEPRLGRIDSKGCIRISHGLNRFLDTYSILDRNYEEWAASKPDSWLLKKDRTPTPFAGKYLIIGDSSPRMQASGVK
ncbi:MAG: hypothetical protein ACOZEN_03430 [Thermodesulfobacteriota bacterium]